MLSMISKPYHSTELPVPPLRHDISLIPVSQDGQRLLLFHDPLGYATPNMALSADISVILQLFDGKTTLAEIFKAHFSKSHTSLTELRDMVTMLDKNRLLHSSYYKQYVRTSEESFEQKSLRKPVCSGGSYPDDDAGIRAVFDPVFKKNETPPEDMNALYAPHIDFRVGLETYAKAFSKIRHLKPERVVVLATSHYSGYYHSIYDGFPFVVSAKSFETPLGTVPVSKSALDTIKPVAGKESGITLRDRAHRIEHSIELHAVMCRYIWDHEFEILPVLVGSLEEYMLFPEGNQGKQLKKTAEVIRQLDDGRTFFLISGDQAHFGRKFGDHFDASSRFEKVEAFDKQFLQKAEKAELSGINELMRDNSDAYRICGYPPLSLFLAAFPEAAGKLIERTLWDEREQQSAVSYAAMGFKW